MKGSETNTIPGGCVAGSGQGIGRAYAKDGTARARGVKFSVKGARGTYSPVTGPLRVTIVFGGGAESAAGQCAVQAFTPLQCVGTPTKLRCK